MSPTIIMCIICDVNGLTKQKTIVCPVEYHKLFCSISFILTEILLFAIID